MSRTTYVIRKIAYFYSDEYYYEARVGGITKIYHDEAAAQQALTKLETARFRSLDFGDIEQTSPCGRPQKYRADREQLHQYFLTTFGQSIFTHDPQWDRLYVDMQTYLPDSMTDEQIMKIRDISKIRFYELSAYEEPEVHFYAIWLVQENKFLQVEIGQDDNAIYFFNSYDEALEGIEELRYKFERVTLKGRLEELSYQPSLLRSLIEGNKAFNYNEAEGSLAFTYNMEVKDLIALNALLKEPIYGIRTIPLEEAAKIPHDPFEWM